MYKEETVYVRQRPNCPSYFPKPAKLYLNVRSSSPGRERKLDNDELDDGDDNDIEKFVWPSDRWDQENGMVKLDAHDLIDHKPMCAVGLGKERDVGVILWYDPFENKNQPVL